ncbi:hypothetical protein [Parapedobacter sp. 10938]|uniref:hypothetical protein n=1 Tax=Parapedobacter flavus TaxID=3110225 RepID=UPI002DB6D089|nr:hypothetical protein [Parapedobacter sp. 10938]MEC3881987.1 hypothetical protein [Parapedobacter sp. 10938]
MKQNPKHEKVIIPKGRIHIFKKVITSIGKEDKQFKKLMAGLPPIQKLPHHSYCYVPFEYGRKIVDDYNELHFEIYGYID